MGKEEAGQAQPAASRRAGLLASIVAGLVAIAETAAHWESIVERVWPQERSLGEPVLAPGSAANAGGAVQTLTGDVVQDNSRNMVLYNTAFRVEVVRATDDAPDTKRELRDDILAVLDGLVGTAPQSLSADQARVLGQRLGTILDQAPVSAYRLDGREFTLRIGTAFYLPGGDDSVAMLGPARDGTPQAIAIRRNGRESTMAVGAVREFRRGAGTCRLLLHEIAADATAATFSYACRP